jgi:hypothetical protein
VMERIARREECEARRSGSPKFYLLISEKNCIFGYYLSIRKQYEKVYFIFMF